MDRQVQAILHDVRHGQAQRRNQSRPQGLPTNEDFLVRIIDVTLADVGAKTEGRVKSAVGSIHRSQHPVAPGTPTSAKRGDIPFVYMDREHTYNKGVENALVSLAALAGERNRVTAIRLGGCIDAIGTEFAGAMRRSGHAHTDKNSAHRGAICIKSRKIETILTTKGTPTRLLAHEFAHIATWQGHTAKWRALMVRLGFPAEAKRYVVGRKTKWSEKMSLTEARGLVGPVGWKPEFMYWADESGRVGGPNYSGPVQVRWHEPKEQAA